MPRPERRRSALQHLCPSFPLVPQSHPISTHVLAVGAAGGRAWETVSQQVRIWPPITGSQCQNLPNCGHCEETVGHSACQGRGPQDRVCGELRVSPLGVCAAQMMGALSLCPCGYHLPCCLAAVSVPGLGLMVHPR